MNKENFFATEKAEILKYFKYQHLPPHLQDVSAPFCETAKVMCAGLPDNAEALHCLRKLLEAKDCAVRSQID